jgi:membrane protein YdbS with pleckstrin-like domain
VSGSTLAITLPTVRRSADAAAPASARAPGYASRVDLSPGETVIFSGRPSWRSILGFYFLGLIAAVAAGVIAGLATSKAGVGAAVGAGLFLVVLIAGFLKRVFTKYTITTRRLRVQRGVLTRHIQETRIDRLQDHSIRQTIVERVLRVGDIDFDTSGEEHADMFRFEGVANPESIILDIDRVIQHAEAAPLPPAASPPPD